MFTGRCSKESVSRCLAQIVSFFLLLFSLVCTYRTPHYRIFFSLHCCDFHIFRLLLSVMILEQRRKREYMCERAQKIKTNKCLDLNLRRLSRINAVIWPIIIIICMLVERIRRLHIPCLCARSRCSTIKSMRHLLFLIPQQIRAKFKPSPAHRMFRARLIKDRRVSLSTRLDI